MEMEIAMKWKIITDSACDVRTLEGLAEDTYFQSVPLHILVDDRAFVDVEGLDTKEMMDAVYAFEGTSRTSCPSPADWMEAYRGAENVIVITISSNLSGSYASANTAKKMLEEDGEAGNIFIMDSLSTGPEMVFLARKTNELIASGLDFEGVCEGLKEYRKKTGVMCILTKMENLVKNGRVKKVTALVAGLLNINIIAEGSKEGTIEMVGKGRGSDKTYRQFAGMLKNIGEMREIMISHCHNLEGAEKLKKRLLEVFENCEITIIPTGGLCSFYAEDQGLIISYELQ